MARFSPGGLPDPGMGASPAPVQRENVKGIWWILTSVLVSSAMTLVVRELSTAMDSRAIVLWRAILTLAVLFPAILLYGPWRKTLRFSNPKAHIWRGVVIAVSTHLGFYSIAHLELVTVTVLFFTAPIWATIFGVLFHGETTGPRRIAAVFIGFVGVLVVLRPGAVPLNPAMLAALGSSILFAIALTLSRGLAEADGPFSAYFSSVLALLVISVPVAIPVMTWPDTTFVWGMVALLVLTGSIRSVADIQAYRFGEASILAPFAYLRLVFIGFGGFAIYAEVPDAAALIGAAIIIGAALYIARREAIARKANLKT